MAVAQLVLTLYDEPDYADWILKAGALGHVTKGDERPVPDRLGR